MKNFILIAGLLFMAACEENSTNNDNASLPNSDTVLKVTDSTTTVTTTTSTVTQMSDQDFVTKAADGGMLEVMLGKLAKEKSASKDVKDFADMMVRDHTKTNDELKALAQKKNWQIPKILSSEKQSKYDELKKKTGSEFDKDFMAFMEEDHHFVLQDFKYEATNGKDADLRNWANGKLATLQQHLKMAQDVNTKVTSR